MVLKLQFSAISNLSCRLSTLQVSKLRTVLEYYVINAHLGRFELYAYVNGNVS